MTGCEGVAALLFLFSFLCPFKSVSAGACLGQEACSDCVSVVGCAWCGYRCMPQELGGTCEEADLLVGNGETCSADSVFGPQGDSGCKAHNTCSDCFQDSRCDWCHSSGGCLEKGSTDCLGSVLETTGDCTALSSVMFNIPSLINDCQSSVAITPTLSNDAADYQFRWLLDYKELWTEDPVTLYLSPAWLDINTTHTLQAHYFPVGSPDTVFTSNTFEIRRLDPAWPLGVDTQPVSVVAGTSVTLSVTALYEACDILPSSAATFLADLDAAFLFPLPHVDGILSVNGQAQVLSDAFYLGWSWTLPILEPGQEELVTQVKVICQSIDVDPVEVETVVCDTPELCKTGVDVPRRAAIVGLTPSTDYQCKVAITGGTDVGVETTGESSWSEHVRTLAEGQGDAEIMVPTVAAAPTLLGALDDSLFVDVPFPGTEGWSSVNQMEVFCELSPDSSVDGDGLPTSHWNATWIICDNALNCQDEWRLRYVLTGLDPEETYFCKSFATNEFGRTAGATSEALVTLSEGEADSDIRLPDTPAELDFVASPSGGNLVLRWELPEDTGWAHPVLIQIFCAKGSGETAPDPFEANSRRSICESIQTCIDASVESLIDLLDEGSEYYCGLSITNTYGTVHGDVNETPFLTSTSRRRLSTSVLEDCAAANSTVTDNLDTCSAMDTPLSCEPFANCAWTDVLNLCVPAMYDCYDCSDDTICKVYSSVDSHYCLPGEMLDDESGACYGCVAGTYNNFEETSICVDCPAGTFSLSRASDCTVCDLGYTSEPGSIECSLCPKGTYAASPGVCEPCPVDTFQSDRGAYLCVPCPPGYTTEGMVGVTGAGCVRSSGQPPRVQDYARTRWVLPVTWGMDPVELPGARLFVDGSVTKELSGIYDIGVEVSMLGYSTTSSLRVTVVQPSVIATITNAGGTILVSQGGGLVLDASKSYSPTGESVTFAWTQVDGGNVVMENTDGAKLSLESLEAGDYTFQVEVGAALASSAVAHAQVSVVEASVANVAIVTQYELRYDAPIRLRAEVSEDNFVPTNYDFVWTKSGGGLSDLLGDAQPGNGALGHKSMQSITSHSLTIPAKRIAKDEEVVISVEVVSKSDASIRGQASLQFSFSSFPAHHGTCSLSRTSVEEITGEISVACDGWGSSDFGPFTFEFFMSADVHEEPVPFTLVSHASTALTPMYQFSGQDSSELMVSVDICTSQFVCSTSVVGSVTLAAQPESEIASVITSYLSDETVSLDLFLLAGLASSLMSRSHDADATLTSAISSTASLIAVKLQTVWRSVKEKHEWLVPALDAVKALSDTDVLLGETPIEVAIEVLTDISSDASSGELESLGAVPKSQISQRGVECVQLVAALVDGASSNMSSSVTNSFKASLEPIPLTLMFLEKRQMIDGEVLEMSSSGSVVRLLQQHPSVLSGLTLTVGAEASRRSLELLESQIDQLVLSEDKSEYFELLRRQAQTTLQGTFDLNEALSEAAESLQSHVCGSDDSVSITTVFTEATETETPFGVMVGGTYEITVFGSCETELEVSGLSEAVEFVLPSPQSIGSKDIASCLYYDEDEEEWSSEGLKTLSIDTFSVKCSTSHFTSFTIAVDYGAATKVTLGLDDLTEEEKNFPWILSGCAGGALLLIIIVFAYSRHKKKKKVLAELAAFDDHKAKVKQDPSLVGVRTSTILTKELEKEVKSEQGSPRSTKDSEPGTPTSTGSRRSSRSSGSRRSSRSSSKSSRRKSSSANKSAEEIAMGGSEISAVDLKFKSFLAAYNKVKNDNQGKFHIRDISSQKLWELAKVEKIEQQNFTKFVKSHLLQ